MSGSRTLIVCLLLVPPIAGCELPPPGVIHVDSEGGIAGAGTGDNPLRLYPKMPWGQYIQNSPGAPQPAGFNITGNGVIGGNLGIGTAAPSSKLTVADGSDLFVTFEGGSAAGLQLKDQNSAENHRAWRLLADSSKLIVQRLKDDFSEVLRTVLVVDGDAVGIGTATPTARLEILAPAGPNSHFTLRPELDEGLAVRSEIRMWGEFQQREQRYAAIQQVNTVGSDANALAFRVNYTTKNIEAMRIDAEGNVGIGTTAPAEKLAIAGGNVSVIQDPSQKGGLVFVAGSTGSACVASGTGTCTQEFGCCTCSGKQGAMTYDQTGGANRGHFYGCRGYGGGTGPCGQSFCWVQLDN